MKSDLPEPPLSGSRADPRVSTPRVPVQQRAQARCDAVLAGARDLLAEGGLADFSIPILARRLSFPRATVYNFFPTPQAILNELARHGLAELERRLTRQIMSEPTRDWRLQIHRSMAVVADFYAERPVDRLLILGTAISGDDSYRAVALTCEHLGRAASRFFAANGVVIPSSPVDVLPLAVNVGTTCLRHSELTCGRITPEYLEAGVQAMVQMLEPYVHAALANRAP